MDAQSFAYWLQGFVELHGEVPTAEQWQSIKDHLALVFKKVTPPIGLPSWTTLPNPMPARHVECSTAGDPRAGQVSSTC